MIAWRLIWSCRYGSQLVLDSDAQRWIATDRLRSCPGGGTDAGVLRGQDVTPVGATPLRGDPPTLLDS